MFASLRFMDRFGFRLWWHSLIDQVILAVAAFVPVLAVFYYFNPSLLFHGKQFFSQMITSPSLDMITYIKNKIAGLEVGITGFLLLLFCWLYLSFSLAGFFGTIGSAVVKRKVSIKRYFSCGFFYFLPFSFLSLILASLFLIITSGFSIILFHAGSFWPVLLPVIAIIYLLFFLIANYSFAVIFVDQENIIRGMREGFRISFRLPGQAISSFLLALMMGLLGLVGIIAISLVPFAVLQFFPDHILTLITGGLLGTLLLLLFSPFPLILFTSTLFYRYVEVVKKHVVTPTTQASAVS